MEPEPQIKHIVRVANTDLDGKKQVLYALRKIKGVSFAFAHAVCVGTGVNQKDKMGLLPDAQVSKLSEAVQSPLKFGIPIWLVNRRRDPESGQNLHLITTNLQLSRENDIKMMKKIKCYKGVRHMLGQPVRGQRTRSHFRANKGKIHLGVKLSTGAKKGGRV